MTVSIVGSFGATTETNTNSGSLGALPAGISNGDRGVCIIHTSLQASTLTPPAGWTVVDTAQTLTTASTWLLTKTLSASDSSTTPTYTVGGAACRVGAAGFVLTGASLDTVSAVSTLGVAGTSMTTPTITPVAADCLQVMVGGISFSSGVGWAAFTPAAGWTEDKDLGSTTTATNVGAYAAHKQLVGQAGVLQSAATFTTTINQRNNVWTVTYATATTPPGVRGDALQHSMNRLAGTTNMDAQGAANIWAGTTGLSLVGALNVKAGNALPAYRELQGVLNQLAGTTGLGVDGAAAAIA